MGKPPLPEEQPTEVEIEPDCPEELPAHLLWIWQGFSILSRTRLVNDAGPQPILISEIANYCDLEGLISEEQRRELLHHTNILDTEWLKVTHARIEKRREEDKKKAEKEGRSKGRRRR